MVTEFLHGPTWQEMMDQLSDHWGLPVVTVDDKGQVVLSSGEKPFAYTIAEKQDSERCAQYRKRFVSKDKGVHKSKDALGLTVIGAPIIVDDRHIGAVIVEGMRTSDTDRQELVKAAVELGLDEEELVDELPNLKEVDEGSLKSLASGVGHIAHVLPGIAALRKEDHQQLDRTNLIIEYLNLTQTDFDVPKLMNKTLEFCMSKFGLEDCSLRYGQTISRFSFYEERNKKCLELENKAWKHLLDTKMPLFVSDPSEQFGISDVRESVLYVPIIWGGDLKGMLSLYSENARKLKGLEASAQDLAKRIEASLTVAERFRQAEHNAVTDSLTGLYNKQYFIEELDKEVARASRHKRPTGLIIFDIDDFKGYNDSYGHPEGDRLLEQMGEVIKGTVRRIDTPCRYGGEEFVVILPETKPQDVQAIAERIRSAVDDHDFPNRKTTISVGCVTCVNSSASPEMLLKEADRALYKSKADGKNVVTPFVIVDKNLATLDVSQT